MIRIRMEEALQTPAPVLRERPDGVGLRGDQIPQALRGGHATGVTARHAHDCDGLLLPSLDLAQTFTGLLQLGGDPLEVADQLFFTRHAVSPGSQDTSSSSSINRRTSSAVADRSFSAVPPSPEGARLVFHAARSVSSREVIRLDSASPSAVPTSVLSSRASSLS